MKVIELIQKLLEFDKNYEVVIAEFYAIPGEDQVLRINHEVIGHMVDEGACEVVFLIPNKEGMIGNEPV